MGKSLSYKEKDTTNFWNSQSIFCLGDNYYTQDFPVGKKY